ncbi:TPA: hypothetical protein ACH3X1_016546 [Trebouxia sp. C0004]
MESLQGLQTVSPAPVLKTPVKNKAVQALLWNAEKIIVYASEKVQEQLKQYLILPDVPSIMPPTIKDAQHGGMEHHF